MKRFRQAIRRSRWLVFLVLSTTSFYSVEGTHYTNAYNQHRAEEERLEELAGRLGVSVDELRRREPGLAAALRNLFARPEDPVRAAGIARLTEQARRHQAQVEGHRFRDQALAVKDRYRLDALDGLLADLLRVGTLDLRELTPAARRAIARNLRTALAEDLRLPTAEGLPPKARAAHNRLQGQLNALRGRLQPILVRPDALDEDRFAQTLGELSAALDGEVRRPRREARFRDRPLPLQAAERSAPRQAADGATAPATSSALVAAPSATAPARRTAAPSIAPEVAALAAELGGSPGRIFAHVHDTIRFDPKWGAVRPPRGTLLEGEGTAWDQAWLLADLLAAAGVEARLEWGEVEIPVELLTNLTGITEPLRAADLLATGGVPIILLVEGSRPVAARIQHVWVVAHVDYIPHRGATPGTPDQWVRMDPSLKRYDHAPGLDVHEHVPFDLGDYLVSGTPLSPRRAYEDALWSYIRANDIACTTLEQLKRQPSPRAERFPYLPGTLRGKILSVAGSAPAVPEAFQHRVRLAVRTAGGTELVTWQGAAAELYGRRVEIAYAGATDDDQATIDSHGGVFETPPYLVDLRPVVRLDGAAVATGAAVASASDTEVWVTLTEATGESRLLTHTGFAGERHVLALDLGQLPAALIDDHRHALAAALAAGDADAAEAETLYLLGAQYLHDLGRDLSDLAGWKHHRLVRLGTEGLITQRGQVTATMGGTPIAFARAARNVDIASMLLGLFHADGETAFKRQTFELLGSQSSFREGEVFATLLEREGIAAVSALTRSRREGQELARVDSGNLEAVLAAVDLGAGVEDEVRHAVGQGRIAWVAESPVGVDRWRGTGYVLEDPATGAAGYLISGGYAGGDETGGGLEALQDLLGSESWLEGSLLGELLRQLLTLLGGGGNGGGGDGPSTQQSDPINMSTGNLWMTETDLTVTARALPIVWSRTYNSRSGHVGPLGRGWTFSYGETVEEGPDGAALYRESDGTEHVFAPGVGGVYAPPPGKHLTLSGDAAGWTLRTKNGLVSRFASDGRLLSIEDPNDNRVTLGYDGAGGLQTVTDAAGRTVLTVTTDAGRITRVTDLSGRFVAFAYDGADLVAVTDTVGETWAYAYDETGNLLARTDPLGNTDSYAHDALDRCYRHVDPLGHEERFSYARRGERAVLTDRRGFDTYLEFDERGRATLQVDPLGNASRSTWDEGNNRASTIDPRGGVTTRNFDERGNLLSETNPLDETTAYTYDPVLNRLLTTTDPTGHVVANTYDGAGNLTETRQTVGGQLVAETYAYDGDGQLVERTDPNGNPTTFSWDASKGSLESQTDALGQTTAIATDDAGRVTSITDPGGNEMSVAWDGRDRMVATVDPYGNAIAIGFDAAGRQVSMTTPRGTSTTAYDAAGRPIAATDVLGATSRTVYDAAGLALERIDALGHTTATTYDPVGRAASQVDPLGATWTFGYCAEIGGGGTGCAGGACGGSGGSDVCELTDPLGNTAVQDFDVLGRVVRRTDPLGNVAVLGYDEHGRHVSSTDPLGKVTRYEYDDLDRLTAVVETNGARTEYTYDAVGNLTNVRDAEGRDWPRTYDELRRQLTEADPLGHTTTSTYDALGNLATRRTANDELIRYEYDVRRLTAIVLPDGSRETFGHDGLGRRTSMANAEVSLTMVYDALDRVTAVTNHALGQTVSYDYDPVGNRIAMLGPMGRIDYHYDARRQLVDQVDPATGTYRLAYDAAGRRTGLVYPNGVATEYDYDSANRLLTLLTRDPQGQVLDGYAYASDSAGRRIEMRSLRDDVLHSYGYDQVDRLTRWQRGDTRFEEYGYDRVGNRLELVDDRGSVTYSYDAANRVLVELRQLSDGGSTITDYTWDNSGRLLSRQSGSAGPTVQTWDALGRLTALDGPTGHHAYGYDPTGIRVRETNGATINRFLHAGEDIVAVYQAGALDRYFAHGPGIDEPWAQATRGATTEAPLAFLHHDALGSVTALSTSESTLHAIASYAAFGSVETSIGSTGMYAYTSREADATGLMYYRARYYQPEVGRFASPDPFRGSDRTPSLQNRYPYVGNQPTHLTDPSGAIALPGLGVGLTGIATGLGLALSLRNFTGGSTGQNWRDHFGGHAALGFFISLVGHLLFDLPAATLLAAAAVFAHPLGLCMAAGALYEAFNVFAMNRPFLPGDFAWDLMRNLLGCLAGLWLASILASHSSVGLYMAFATGLALGYGVGLVSIRL